MKILFVDESSNLQEKWIEPLRGEGWGVVRARSTEDAEKIFEFHGDSLTALVVSENFVEWVEKWNYPYVVFTKNWKEAQVVKHQNSSSRPAIAYLEFDSNLELVKQTLMESKTKSQAVSLKATGTSAYVRPVKQPSIVAPIESSSAASTSSSESNQESVVISFDQYSDQKIELESTSHQSAAAPVTKQEVQFKAQPQLDIQLDTQEEEIPEAIVPDKVEDVVEAAVEAAPQDNDRTMMLDVTSLSNLSISADIEHIEEERRQTPRDEIQQEEHQESEESFSMDSAIEESSENEAQDIADSSEYVSTSVGSKDVETMKNYLALREQDVAILTGQMRSTQERIQQLEMLLKMEKARSGELQHLVQKQDQQIKNFDRDKQVEFEVLYQQVEDLNLQLRERTDKVRTIDAKLKITTDEVEKIKERVRVDIRRIRVREKELESQLEVLKKDSTALLMARDEKIHELKRKIDLIEFNMELVQEQYGKERNNTEQLRHKLKEAAGVMKRAGGLLDHEN